MKLHVTITGSGPDLVLLHGWGLNSAIWDGVTSRLAGSSRLHRIDLPGHGHSEWRPGLLRLDDFARAVAPYIPRDATVVGWSLGGILGLHLAALLPERIGRLVLISTTPRFVTDTDWTTALSPTVLADFASRLRDNFRATVQEFLTLQVRGEQHELAALRELRQALIRGGLPHAAALEAGLEILRTVDLRASLPRIIQPALIVAGEKDRVTPPGASRYLAAHLAEASLCLIPRAGHAPFISHADEFLAELEEFLERRSPAFRDAGTGS